MITVTVGLVSMFRPGFNLNDVTAIVLALATLAAAAAAIVYTSRTRPRQLRP